MHTQISEQTLFVGECLKINTGAPVPSECDAIVQIEDTKIVRKDPTTGKEIEIEILVEPFVNMDIRSVVARCNKICIITK